MNRSRMSCVRNKIETVDYVGTVRFPKLDFIYNTEPMIGTNEIEFDTYVFVFIPSPLSCARYNGLTRKLNKNGFNYWFR